MIHVMPNETSYDDLRPLLMSIAYRMLGSVGDAEDVVQESFLRFHRALGDGVQVESPKAYLTTVVTRLAIDQLRSARVQRERYIGPWLPEPVVDGSSDVAAEAEIADSLSMAFLVLLERLSPVQRAVFLLRDVFRYEFAEIASVVDRSESNCRQILVRARRHLEDGRTRFDVSRPERDELAGRFLAACRDGDLDGLTQLLAADAAFVGDGGGKAQGLPRPVFGRDKVARLLAGFGNQYAGLQVRFEPVRVGGQPGALLWSGDELLAVWSLDVVDGVVSTVRSVVNPDKLAHIRY